MVSQTLSNFGSAPAASGRDGRYGANFVCAVANPIFRLVRRANLFANGYINKKWCRRHFQTLEVPPRRAVGMGVTEQTLFAQ